MSFIGGGLFGMFAGRVLLGVVPWLRDDRLAEATLTLALAYGVFIVSRAPLSHIGRRRRVGLRHDHQRARPFSYRALQLVVPDRSLGPDRLLGPLLDLYPRVDPYS